MILQRAMYNFGIRSIVTTIPGSSDHTHLAYLGVTIWTYQQITYREDQKLFGSLSLALLSKTPN